MARKVLVGLVLLIGIASSAQAQTTRTVCASGCTRTNAQLQTALDESVAGDTVLLQEGFTYTGVFTLRRHGGASHITVKTGVTAAGAIISSSQFPAADIRMTPALATSSNLAKLQSATGNSPALSTASPSGGTAPAYWRIELLEFLHNSGTLGADTIIRLGSDSNSTQTVNAEIPSDFIFSQVYVHGHAIKGQKRGFSIHANNVTIRDSYISDIKSQTEGQGIWLNSFDTGFTLTNTYVEGGTETLLSGGGSGCCRPAVTVASASSATTFVVTATTDLKVGQGISVEANGTLEEYREVASCGTSTPGAACTSTTIVVDRALSQTPIVGADVDWGPVPSNITISKSHLTRPVSHRSAILGTPQSVTLEALDTGGTLAAGSYCYRIVARMPTADGQTARSAASTQVCATTTGSTGSVVIRWAAVTNAETYYIYGRNSGGQNIRWSVSAPTVTYTDTGSTGTTETVPTSSGTTWLVKNTLEFKIGNTILVEGSVIERSWEDGQSGYCVVITPAATGGGNDSTHVRNVTMRNNIIRHCAGVWQITARDVGTNAPQQLSGQLRDVLFENNLIYDVNNSWRVDDIMRSVLFSTKSRIANYAATEPLGALRVRWKHNTIVHAPTGSAMFFWDFFKGGESMKCTDCEWSDNIAYRHSYGMTGNNSVTEGNGAWTAYTDGTAIWQNNVIAGATCSLYPGGSAENFCPSASALEGEFVDYANNNFALRATSPYRNAASDGTDIGANISAITPLTNVALSGDNRAAVTPVVPPSIQTLSLPGGQVGGSYNQTINGTCNATPCTWGTTGTLPTSVVLTSVSTGSASQATLSASVLQDPAGTFNFTVTLTDAGGRVGSQAYTVTITSAPPPPPDPGDGTVRPVLPRPDKFNLDEGVFFRRATDPCLDPDLPVRVGDIWVDISEIPHILKMLEDTSPSCIWADKGPRTTLNFVAPGDGNSVTWTQGTGELELNGSPSRRGYIDAAPYGYVRLVMRVQGANASPNTPQCYLKYSTDDSTFTTLTGTEISLSAAGTKKSAWAAIPVAAQADVIYSVFCSGGNATSWAFGTMAANFK